MRCVVQRVKRASVAVDGRVVGAIGEGLLVLAAFAADDGEAELAWTARKLPALRLFNDAEGKMNRSLQDTGGGILLISQFTLYGDCRRGNRPSFADSASPEQAAGLYARFAELLRGAWPATEEGVFAASMAVELLNDGPVTLILDRPHREDDVR
jgi:D-tyrosyl-tRNA(Tyr) deacylase